MNYKLRKQYTTNPEKALSEILIDRGVQDIESFLYPTSKCELDPHDLENIELAAELLLRHLRANSNILIVADKKHLFCASKFGRLFLKTKQITLQKQILDFLMV